MSEEKEQHAIKRTINDSVFTNLFGTKKYLLQFYQALHPDDVSISEDDIDIVTLENILTDGQYNDLGATIRKDKMIFLCEAQSTWSLNVLFRILMYLAETYSRYCQEHNIDLYKSKLVPIPKPELYVLYTGDRKTHPAEISLRNDVFHDPDCAIDIKVKMIYDSTPGDIINQYVAFTRISKEQIKQYGQTEKAIKETIRICKDRNILKEYLESKEVEVESIMGTLFGQDEISRIHDVNLKIQQYVEDCMEFNQTKDETIGKVQTKFSISKEDARQRVDEYWKEEALMSAV